MKVHSAFKLLSVVLTVCLLTGCLDKDLDPVSQGSEMEGKLYPESFGFETASAHGLTVEIMDNGNIPMVEIPVELYSIYRTESMRVASGQTNKNGSVHFDFSLGNHIDSLLIKTAYIGLPEQTFIPAEINNVLLGGFSDPGSTSVSQSTANNFRVAMNELSYIGDWSSGGTPYYLEPVNDYVSQDMLDLVNSSLPEGRPVPSNNPEYLNDTIISDTQLKDSAEVWVTFVHEGAGWRNSLGFYTYNLRNPPVSVDDVTDFYVIFPNVSFENGVLNSGNKVYLGNFPENTGIGWFLIPQGWNGTGVRLRDDIKYSNKEFNNFTSSDYRIHTVLLKDDVRKLLLLGMEDISRPGGDNDFNDAVFYVKVNPYEALLTSNLESTKTEAIQDTDSDGVADENDSYPDDPSKAFDRFTPGENVFGSLAFEDLWPEAGDYDVNDLVLDYNFQEVQNVAQEVVQLNATFKIRAMGALYENGFGFSLRNVHANKVANVTGQKIIENDEIVLQANGIEVGVEEAAILVFDNAFRIWEGSNTQTNTVPGKDYVQPYEFALTIIFTEPIASSDLGYAPFNPFIFRSGDRGLEVHLKNQPPTSKAHQELFGTGDDASLGDSYYHSSNYLPWAFHLPIRFDYPKETESISNTFSFFDTWAETNGVEGKDWYINQSGYRDQSKIYQIEN